MNSNATPSAQPLWQGRGLGRLEGKWPLERRLLTASKAHTPARSASDPRPVTPTMPSSTHAGVLTAKATKNTRPIVNIEVPVDGFSLKLATGAGKLEDAGFETQMVARKAPNNIRIRARLKMPLNMLLERAVGAH